MRDYERRLAALERRRSVPPPNPLALAIGATCGGMGVPLVTSWPATPEQGKAWGAEAARQQAALLTRLAGEVA